MFVLIIYESREYTWTKCQVIIQYMLGQDVDTRLPICDAVSVVDCLRRFRGPQRLLESGRSLKTWETARPMTRRNIPEDLYL